MNGTSHGPSVISYGAGDGKGPSRPQDSPWSSTLSNRSLTSPEPSTTRSTTPGTSNDSLSPRKADVSSDPAYPLAWPPKAAHLLGANGPNADRLIVKGGPANRAVRKERQVRSPRGKGHKFSAEMEKAFPSREGPKKPEPPVLLDIGPTKRAGPLELIKRPFESDGIFVQFLYGDTGKSSH